MTACLALGEEAVISFFVDENVTLCAERHFLREALEYAAEVQLEGVRHGWRQHDIAGFCPG